jgi:NAD(P)-dependent dehydrogenase (short-subunit alcohol dehydrogenase family)
MTTLVLGGRSEIGVAVAKRLGGALVLAARRSDDLDAEVAVLTEAGGSVTTVEFDADDVAGHGAFLDRVTEAHGLPETVVVAFGILGDQARAERDAAHAMAIVHTDYLAHVGILTEVAARFRERGSGTIVVFSSVAGVRVRKANYVYGSAKAGLDGFASGMADALHGTGVRLVLVRPGFVIGRMTAGMSPAPMSSTPDQVADATVAALRKGKDVVWVPRMLRPVFFVMRLLPRGVWRRLPR